MTLSAFIITTARDAAALAALLVAIGVLSVMGGAG